MSAKLVKDHVLQIGVYGNVPDGVYIESAVAVEEAFETWGVGQGMELRHIQVDAEGAMRETGNALSSLLDISAVGYQSGRSNKTGFH